MNHPREERDSRTERAGRRKAPVQTSSPIADATTLEELARRDVESVGGVAATGVVVAPYRICPLGAHSDHQGGTVLGMTISAYTVLAFVPTETSGVRLLRGGTDDEVLFDLHRPFGGASRPDRPIEWGDYPRGCAELLRQRLPHAARGLLGSVRGSLPGAGLSSSASVNLAYLSALAAANELALDAHELAVLAMRVEREVLGLSCGLLDPATIVGSRRHHLLRIDCREERWTPLPPGPEMPPYRILIAFSGETRQLTATGFNDRVAECAQAAGELAAHSGLDTVTRLGDLPLELVERGLDALSSRLARRARHYATEARRVQDGIDAWQRGDLETFAGLMDASCASSIANYECGSPAIIDLHRTLAECDGVLGNRFSGGGYGGCCVALVRPEQAQEVLERSESRFRQLHPELAERTRFFLAESVDGVCRR